MRGRGGVVVSLLLGALVGCGGSGDTHSQDVTPPSPSPTPPPPAPPPPAGPKPPIVSGDFTYWSADQGLTRDVMDVSADEGGNVYVAASDALFVRARADRDFRRVDPGAAGITSNCWDEADIQNEHPSGPPHVCPIISVAGAASGKAVIGFKGVGIDEDHDASWALDSGGADVISFDGSAVSRDRHVRVASPPGVVCERWADPPANTTCGPGDFTFAEGRRKMRQIQRIVVNHDRRHDLSYGDVYMGGTHGSLAILVAHPQQRGWHDYTKGDPRWADTRYVWEHHHPAPPSTDGRFLSGEAWAIALDPIHGVPWYANQFRIARLAQYPLQRAPDGRQWWGDQDPPSPHLAIWAAADPQDPNVRDNVYSMSFCDDGTLWIASAGHGLARLATDGSISEVHLPSVYGDNALAAACDPSDQSVWVGFGWGGFGRYKDGKWWVVGADAPTFAFRNPVLSIQIDRWTTPRIVHIATHSSPTFGPGGVTVYAGP
jgi:hypothetical protein